jgi:hypothetical protein
LLVSAAFPKHGLRESVELNKQKNIRLETEAFLNILEKSIGVCFGGGI